jgi:hypothetical protein
MGLWSDRFRASPVQWVLEKACPPIQFRTYVEILGRSLDDWDVQRAKERVYAYEPAVAISRSQQPAGTWLDKILDFEAPNPTRRRGPGMVNQVLALLEYGWELSHPIVHCSAELLYQYLDPLTHVELYELNAWGNEGSGARAAVRGALSRISGAVLARAGSRDPRLLAFGERLLATLDVQYRDPANPTVYEGVVEVPEEGTFRRLRPDGVPIDMFTLYALAFLPGVLATDRARTIAARAVSHLFAGSGEPRVVVEVDGRRVLRMRLPRIADLGEAEFADQKLGYLVHDLELLARIGVLERHPKARALLEWVLGFAQDDGVLRPGRELEKAVTPSQYHYFPLEESWRGKHKKFTDVTFRALLIATLLDRQPASAGAP